MKTKPQIKNTSNNEGKNYPKEKILEIVKTFGFFVDLDRWDDKNYEWMRIENEKFPDSECIIIHKHHLETAVHSEKIFLLETFKSKLIQIGEEEFKKKFNDLMKIK